MVLGHVWSVVEHIWQISINWPNLRGTPIKGLLKYNMRYIRHVLTKKPHLCPSLALLSILFATFWAIFLDSWAFWRRLGKTTRSNTGLQVCTLRGYDSWCPGWHNNTRTHSQTDSQTDIYTAFWPVILLAQPASLIKIVNVLFCITLCYIKVFLTLG